MNNIRTAVFEPGSCTASVSGLWQYNYGQILRIQGLDLPTAVEIHFSTTDKAGDSVTRIGTTKDGVTDVVIPDSLIEGETVYATAASFLIYAFIYMTDETSGQTEYKIRMTVTCRPKPEAFDSPEDAELFREAIKTVNDAVNQVEAIRDNLNLDLSEKVTRPQKAEVGQILVVKAVDDDGKPTEFEAVNDEAASQEEIGRAVSTYLAENPIEETDPTVPDWAKNPKKPTYTASEVGALPDTTKIPSKTSDLENDSGFLTEHQDISGYALKSEIPKIDATLTESGKAADAKVTGENFTKLKGDLSQLSEEKVENPPTGVVGQILEIETVDESGKPKTYKAVNKPSGGGEVTDEQISNAVDNYMTAHPFTETDPTVPDWAKQPEKPTYTASEVVADAAGTAESKVSEHNVALDAHNDIRLLIHGLTERLNALADSDDETLDQMSEVVAYVKSNKSLIDSITTSKVNVSDIIDNLTTNVSNKPLSAAQGVALKALIDAIAVPDKLPNPQKLTFTGAVTAEYDGSGAVTVDIPSGGITDEWNLIDHFTVEKAALNYEIPLQDGAKEYGIYWAYSNGSVPQRSIAVSSNLAQYGVMFRNTTNEICFIKVFKGPNNILAISQNVSYAASRFYNGGTYIGSGTDFPSMKLESNIECESQEIWVYWR